MKRLTPKTVLAQLAAGLEPSGVRLYVAGGLALLLREAYLERVGAETRIPDVVRGRATEDVDVVLTRDLILQATLLETIRAEIDNLGFVDAPDRARMQFVLAEEQDLKEWSIRVDFLAPPVEGADIDGNAVSASRKTRLAGWNTPEALTLEEHPLDVTVGPSGPLVRVPHPFTILVMKLVTLADYIERGKYPFKAQNHAVDVLRSIGLMTPNDWTEARDIAAKYRLEQPIAAAAGAASRHLSGGEAPGIILIREWARREHQDVTPGQIEVLLDDLDDLFRDIG